MIKLHQISRVFQDCTANYAVTLDKEYTVKELITEILTKPEWGHIGIYKKDQDWFSFGDPFCEFKHGELLSNLPDCFLNKNVILVKASGGYSRMDYLIYTEDQIEFIQNI